MRTCFMADRLQQSGEEVQEPSTQRKPDEIVRADRVVELDRPVKLLYKNLDQAQPQGRRIIELNIGRERRSAVRDSQLDLISVRGQSKHNPELDAAILRQRVFHCICGQLVDDEADRNSLLRRDGQFHCNPASVQLFPADTARSSD